MVHLLGPFSAVFSFDFVFLKLPHGACYHQSGSSYFTYMCKQIWFAVEDQGIFLNYKCLQLEKPF